MSYTVYAYHKGISDTRFDAGMTEYFCNLLETKTQSSVQLILNNGDNSFYENSNDIFKIPHGSLCIIENNMTHQFHVSDFGDNCADVFPLSTFTNFSKMTLGQFNRYKIEKDIQDTRVIQKIQPGYYPETHWNFGEQYYSYIQQYRDSITLDNRLHFRGSIYSDLRNSILLLQRNSDVYIGHGRLEFNSYLQEVSTFKLTLSMGMSPYQSDLCFRDIEMFGLGIPVIRPTLHVELNDPLIPNVHYIACDVKLDPYTLWTNNHEDAAAAIYRRYYEVIHDSEYLQYISDNARQWYLKNIANGAPAINLLSWLDI